MRVFAFSFHEEKKCPDCNWETSRGYVVARGKEQARELIKEGHFLCGNCLADRLTQEDMVIADPRNFDPNDYDVAVPNWLTREDAEEHLGKLLTDEEWKDLKEWIEEELMDETMETIWWSLDHWKQNRLH